MAFQKWRNILYNHKQKLLAASIAKICWRPWSLFSKKHAPSFRSPPRPHCAQRDLCGAYCTHTLLSDDVSMTSPWIISGGDRTGTTRTNWGNSSRLKFEMMTSYTVSVEISQSSHDMPQNESSTMSVWLFVLCVCMYCGFAFVWQNCHRTMDHTMHALEVEDTDVEHVWHHFRRSQNPNLTI